MWCTFNEPNQLVFGYIKPWWQPNYAMPPGLPEGATADDQIQAVAKLMRNLFLAHTEARRIIREANPDALVSTNPLLLGLPVWLQRFVNWNASRIRTYDDFARQNRRLSERAFAEKGHADLVLAMLSRTPEREQQVMFSEPYFIAGQGVLVSAASSAAGVRDLARQSIAAVRGSTAETRVSELLPGTTLKKMDDYAQALAAVDAARGWRVARR